ncbi:MAG: histidinol-phosphatase HisJ family protein [Lentisphaerae bacterium]|nr:histidinol-phosphatase HisJ family protein [Lentisphaerota bacterium]
MSLLSYHCHSTWSDGQASIAAMIAGAAAAGLREFGLSDHYACTPYDDTCAHLWSMPRNGRALEGCLAELAAAAAAAPPPLIIRRGVEADYFPETWREVRGRLERLDLDYVIASVHYVERFPVDNAARFWEALSQADIDRIYRGYWERVRQLAECRLGDIVGHLDLPKKFGFVSAADLSREIGDALDAIATAGLCVELNTAGWDKPCAAPYPSAELLREVQARGIPVMLNADAHTPTEVARHYSRGVALLRECGFRALRGYARRQAWEFPLPE